MYHNAPPKRTRSPETSQPDEQPAQVGRTGALPKVVEFRLGTGLHVDTTSQQQVVAQTPPPAPRAGAVPTNRPW